MSLVHESEHPLVRQKLALLRDKATRPSEFRGLVRSLAGLLAYEACSDLTLKPVEVMTPLGLCKAFTLADRVGIVPILRAGLGMCEGILDLIPDAQVWHIGLFRDEQTLQPTEYYNKLPVPAAFDIALVVDPMLATGGSAIRTCEVLRRAGVTRIKFLALIAAPEGIAKVTESFPNMHIHVCVVDDYLNEVGYIYPGLGDAGDRQFATVNHSS